MKRRSVVGPVTEPTRRSASRPRAKPSSPCRTSGRRSAPAGVVIQAWVTTPAGALLRPDVLQGLEGFARGLEADRRVGSVTGPTTLLRFMRYVAGEGDRLPDDPGEWPALAAQLDQLLLQEPA